MAGLQVLANEKSIIGSPGDRLSGHRAPLLALTGIRFFAALYVVLYHSKLPDLLFGVATHHASLFPALRHASLFVSNGYLAVLLFFLLSGFILAYTYHGQIAGPRKKRRFWEARFARIWPLYVVSLLLSSATLHTTPSALRALATLAMVQAWNPGDVDMAGTWNFVCWTLSTEAFFYLIFPFFQQWLERQSQRVHLALTIALMALSVSYSGGLHVYGYPLRGVFTHLPLALLHAPEFLVGACLGNMYLTSKRTSFLSRMPNRNGNGSWTWISLLASIALLIQPPSHLVALTIVSFAALLFGLASEPSLPRTLLSSGLLLVGGEISYGMYLLQWPCKVGVNFLCDLLGANSVAFRFSLYLLGLIFISTAGFYLIENPARRLLRSIFARLEHIG